MLEQTRICTLRELKLLPPFASVCFNFHRLNIQSRTLGSSLHFSSKHFSSEIFSSLLFSAFLFTSLLFLSLSFPSLLGFSLLCLFRKFFKCKSVTNTQEDDKGSRLVDIQHGETDVLPRQFVDVEGYFLGHRHTRISAPQSTLAMRQQRRAAEEAASQEPGSGGAGGHKEEAGPSQVWTPSW